MVSREEIQGFIDRLNGNVQSAEEVETGLWVLKATNGAELVIHYNPPVVVLRVRVMEPPANEPRRADLYRQLLEFNARDLVHGSYGLEGDHVVLTDALELASLDFGEFQASFDSILLALASHLGTLAPFRER